MKLVEAIGKKFRAKKNVLVIGVGNAYRSDDAVGLVAARRIAEKGLTDVEVVNQTGDGAALIELWQDAGTVILVDIVQADAQPGSIHRFEAGVRPVPKEYFHYSTHLFGVAEAVELARALKKLPPRLIVYGVKGKDLSPGTNLSPEVEAAVPEVVERALQDIHAAGATGELH